MDNNQELTSQIVAETVEGIIKSLDSRTLADIKEALELKRSARIRKFKMKVFRDIIGTFNGIHNKFSKEHGRTITVGGHKVYGKTMKKLLSEIRLPTAET